jgi:hypothetical protein
LVMFMIFMAVLTAAAVLLFREILILACVILGPLALLAWILPGTAKYWKMWWENFSKALLIFPLIMALIAVGRVFAWVIGANEGNPGMFDWFGVLIGFFLPYYLLPKTFKWGGSLMASAGSAINGAMKPISNFGNKEIRDTGQRYQGKWAKAYDPNDPNTARRALRRFQSGHAIPLSKRSQRLAIAKGDKWSSERDDEALALIKRKGEKVLTNGYVTKLRDSDGNLQKYDRDAAGNLLDEQGNITTDESKAKKIRATGFEDAADRQLTGVAAMKQMWVDIAENGRDKNEQKMAVRQLTATSSWPELQGSFTTSGKRVQDLGIWRDAVATSQEDYPKVLRSRVDLAPHIVDSSEKALAREKAQGRTFTEEEERNFKAAYRINYAIENQMSNEDFATQSDGFWEETARQVQKGGHEGDLIRANLQARLKAIAQTGTAGQQILGHLSGGGVQPKVEAALGESFQAYLAGTGSVGTGAIAVPRGGGGTTGGVITVSPSEIKITHENTAKAVLPSDVSLADPVQRQAYKIRLKTDPRAVQTLANSLAYEVAPTENRAILDELRAEAMTTGTPETKEAYNRIIDEVQRAYSERIANTAQATAARGRDPSVARDAAQGRLAPEIIDFESRRIP